MVESPDRVTLAIVAWRQTVARWIVGHAARAVGDYGSWGPLFSGMHTSQSAEMLGLSSSTYDRASTVYACIDRITSRARRCPWLVQQHGPDDTVTNLPPADPLAAVLRTPNTYQGSGELREVLLRSLLMSGEAFLLPLYDGGRLTALHVIPQSAVTIPPVRLSLAEAPVVSYHLAGLTLRNIPGRPPQLIHLRINPLPGFPPRGRSPVGLHADLAAIEVAGSEHVGRRLTRGVTAHLALTAETDQAHATPPELVQKIVKSANEQLSGLANVGAVIAPPPGFGFKPIELSNRNMQFLETQKYTREQICGLFNVPTPLVGDISRATYSNMRQILSSFQREAVNPLLAVVTDALTSALCWDRPDQVITSDTSAVAVSDPLLTAQEHAILLENGVLSVEQWRVMSELERDETGQYFRKSGLVPLNEEAETDPDETKEDPDDG